MPTLKDLIVEYENEFTQRLKRYSTEDFSEFIDDHVEKCKKLLSKERDEEIVLADDPQIQERKKLNDTRKNFYDTMLKHDKEYENWRLAFAGIFGNIGGYWKAIEPVIGAEKVVAQNLKGLNDRKDKYNRFIKAAEKQRKEMGYLCFPLSPLLERYDIKLKIYTLNEEGNYQLRATEDLNELLKDPKLTVFGRKAPETSRLYKHALKDISISKQQGCFGINRDGDIVVQNLGKNSGRLQDYDNTPWIINPEESKRLFPAFFDKNEGGSASIYFGGRDKNYFKLEIVLELKIKEGQLKGK